MRHRENVECIVPSPWIYFTLLQVFGAEVFLNRDQLWKIKMMVKVTGFIDPTVFPFFSFFFFLNVWCFKFYSDQHQVNIEKIRGDLP